MRVLQDPNPFLRRKCYRVKPASIKRGEYRMWVNAMIHAVEQWEKNRPGEYAAALAAPQAGFDMQIVIVRRDGVDLKELAFDVYYNPRIIGHSLGKRIDREGCLSVTGHYEYIERWRSVEVEALNAQGLPVRLEAHGHRAKVWQHEIDHLNGVLFTDHKRVTA